MKKIITPLVDIVLCTYIITTCFICLAEFNNWQNKIIAVTITIGSAYIAYLWLTDTNGSPITGSSLVTGRIGAIILST